MFVTPSYIGVSFLYLCLVQNGVSVNSCCVFIRVSFEALVWHPPKCFGANFPILPTKRDLPLCATALSSHHYFPAFGQAMVKGAVPQGAAPPAPPGGFCIAHRVQHSHSTAPLLVEFHSSLLAHALTRPTTHFLHFR